MNNIPPEIYQKISRYLQIERLLEASLSCKQWFVGFIPLIWSDIKIANDQWDGFHKQMRRSNTKYAAYIKKFSIVSISVDCKLSNVVQFTKNCARLISFSIDTPDLGDDEIWILLKSCPLLKSLRIATAGKVTDVGLETIASSDSVQELYFSCHNQCAFSGRGLIALANRDTKLLGYGLSWCEKNKRFLMSSDNLSISSGLEALLSKHLELRELRIDWPGNMDSPLRVAAQVLTKLHTLMIGNHRDVKSVLDLIARNQLRRLTLHEVHLGSQVSIIANSPIVELDFNGVCSLEELSLVISHMSELQSVAYFPTSRYAQVHQNGSLSLATNHKLKTAMLPINDNETLLSCCNSNLKNLGIDGRSVDNHGIVIMCTKLKLVSLDLGHAEIGPSGINSLISYMGDSLEHLTLPPSGITSKDILRLLTGLRCLKTLRNIPGLTTFDDLQLGVQNCPTLQEISIVAPILPTLTKELIGRVKFSSKRLKRVNLLQYIF